MIDPRYLAVYAMCVIVITLYAMRNNNADWLPDFFGLTLAMLAPRQSLAIGAVIILAVIRHSILANGLAELVPDWLLPVVLPGARDMSIDPDEAEQLEEAYKDRVAPTERLAGNEEIPQPVAEIDQQIINSANADLMAKAVLVGAIGLTEAVRIASGAKSGRRYQAWTRQIKLAMERQQNHYADLDQHRRQVPPPPN